MMKTWFVPIVAALMGAFRGIEQGMVMTLANDPMNLAIVDGIRGHVGFERYHLISGMVVIFAALLGYMLIHARPRIMYLAGIGFLLWEVTEVGYSFGRSGSPFQSYEHINFLDMFSIYAYGWKVCIIHIARIAAAFILIKGGLSETNYLGITRYNHRDDICGSGFRR